MKLYLVQFDGEPDYVEAESFGDAIRKWKVKLIADNPDSDMSEDEPDSVALVHDQPVIR